MHFALLSPFGLTGKRFPCAVSNGSARFVARTPRSTRNNIYQHCTRAAVPLLLFNTARRANKLETFESKTFSLPARLYLFTSPSFPPPFSAVFVASSSFYPPLLPSIPFYPLLPLLLLFLFRLHAFFCAASVRRHIGASVAHVGRQMNFISQTQLARAILFAVKRNSLPLRHLQKLNPHPAPLPSEVSSEKMENS